MLESVINIYVLSTHVLNHVALQHICGGKQEFHLVGSAYKIPTDVETIASLHPDLIIIGQELLTTDSLKDVDVMLGALHKISRITILADRLDISLACIAVANGIGGYLLTSASVEEMLQALHVVVLGGLWLEKKVVQLLVNRAGSTNIKPNKGSTLSHLLSEREQQILRLVAKGQGSKDIAEQLYLSESSVRTYWYRILNKLNAVNKAEAITIASRLKLLDDTFML
jgi:two-component system NarL family response regulator